MRFLVFLSLVFSINVQARPSLPQASFDSAVETLSDYAIQSGFVKTLGRDIHIYHYSTDKIENPFEYAKFRAESFLMNGRQKGIEDHHNLLGLYFSTDPAATRRYSGEKNWRMLRMNLSQGTVFLDLGKSSSKKQGFFEFPQHVITALQKADCSVYKLSGINKAPRPKDFFLKNYDQDCKDIVDTMLARLGIQAMFYDFPGAEIEGCQPNRRQTAVVLVGTSTITGSKLRVFGDHSQWDAQDPEMLALYWMFNRSSSPEGSNFVETYRQTHDFLSPLEDSGPLFLPPKSWFDDTIFACSGKWPEDSKNQL